MPAFNLKDSAWRVIAFVGVVLLLQLGLPTLLIGAAMSSAPLLSLDAQRASALQMALVTIAQIVALPFSFIAHTLRFFDLRIRSQDFDAEQHDPLTPEWNDGNSPSWLNV